MPGPPGLHARDRVLEYRRGSGFDTQQLRPRRYGSGAGLPAMFSSRNVTPSTRCCTNRSRPVISSTSRVLALEDTTAIARPACAAASR